MKTLRTHALTLLLALAAALAAVPAWAQDGDPPPENARTAFQQEIDLTELAHRLKPLTKQQLEVEAKAWQQLLRATQIEVSGLRVESLSAQGAELEAKRERLAKLVSQRTRIYDRNRAVLGELQLKGGDIEEYRAYADAVADITAEIDVTDASGAWTTIKSWGKSEEGGLRWARNIGKFLLVLVIAWLLGKIVAAVLRRLLNTAFMDFNEMLERFAVNIAKNVILLIGILVALSMLEVEVGPMLAAMGVAGFILGFALQETLGNFAAGLMILIYQPYDLGDWIKAAGEQGSVKHMNLVSTVLTSGDNQLIVIPNGKIWGGTITNVTGSDKRRIDLTFGVAYEDDIEKASSVLTEIVTAHEKVLDDPAPVIRLHELADSSVNFVVRPWVRTPDYWTVRWDVTAEVKRRFDAEGISIPYPQRDVHVVRTNGPLPE